MTHWLTARADHVRAHKADEPAGHTCHWPGCGVLVAPALWGCGRHWFKLPRQLRLRIWGAYRPGQEQDKKPSKKYVQLMKEVQAWIAKTYPANTQRTLM